MGADENTCEKIANNGGYLDLGENVIDKRGKRKNDEYVFEYGIFHIELLFKEIPGEKANVRIWEISFKNTRFARELKYMNAPRGLNHVCLIVIDW